jgi:hypothetical protein
MATLVIAAERISLSIWLQKAELATVFSGVSHAFRAPSMVETDSAF